MRLNTSDRVRVSCECHASETFRLALQDQSTLSVTAPARDRAFPQRSDGTRAKGGPHARVRRAARGVSSRVFFLTWCWIVSSDRLAKGTQGPGKWRPGTRRAKKACISDFGSAIIAWVAEAPPGLEPTLLALGMAMVPLASSCRAILFLPHDISGHAAPARAVLRVCGTARHNTCAVLESKQVPALLESSILVAHRPALHATAAARAQHGRTPSTGISSPAT